jgi:hypothetical protein
MVCAEVHNLPGGNLNVIEIKTEALIFPVTAFGLVINAEQTKYMGAGITQSVGARFFAHVQTGPGAHPASCTVNTGSFPGVKRPGRGADHPPPSSSEVKKE